MIQNSRSREIIGVLWITDETAQWDTWNNQTKIVKIGADWLFQMMEGTSSVLSLGVIGGTISGVPFHYLKNKVASKMLSRWDCLCSINVGEAPLAPPCVAHSANWKTSSIYRAGTFCEKRGFRSDQSVHRACTETTTDIPHPHTEKKNQFNLE